MAEKLEFELDVKGASKVETALKKVEDRLKRLESTQKKVSKAAKGSASAQATAAKGMGAVDKATKAANLNLAHSVNNMTELTFAMSQAVPGMQQFGTSIAMAGNSAFMMISKMGALGVAFGAVQALLPVIVGQFGDLFSTFEDGLGKADAIRDKVDALTDSIRAQREAIADYQQDLTELSEQELEARQADAEAMLDVVRGQDEHFRERIRQLAELTGSEKEREKAIEDMLEGRRSVVSDLTDLEQQALANELAIRNEGVRRIMEIEQEKTRRLIEEAQNRAAELANIEAQSSGVLLPVGHGSVLAPPEEPAKPTRRGGGGRRRGPDPFAILQGDLTPQAGVSAAEAAAMEADIRARKFEEERDFREMEADADAARLAALEQQSQLLEDQIFSKEKMIEEERRQQSELDRHLKSAAKFGDIGREAGQILVSALKDGPEAALEAWLEGEAIKNTILALEQTAMGIGKMFVPGGQAEAVGHFTSAAKHGVVAALAGGGAAIAGSGGGGGGGGASDTGNTRPSEPSGRGGGSSNEPGTTVINVNSPISSMAELGRHVNKAERARVRRHGS